jgi:hypothetical protein
MKALFEKAEQFIRTSIELLKLKALDKAADTISSIVSGLAMVIFLFFFIFILSIGLALYLGDILGKAYLGFFIVSGFYMVCGILVKVFGHTWLKMPVFNAIVKKTLK